jgi:hypothetical protein
LLQAGQDGHPSFMTLQIINQVKRFAILLIHLATSPFQQFDNPWSLANGACTY